jgi:hypothetical protein
MIKAIQNELGGKGLGNHSERGLVCVFCNCFIGGNRELRKRALKALVAKRLMRYMRGVFIFSLALCNNMRRLYC